MPAIVTKSYLDTARRYKRAGGLGRSWKDEAHARLRTEERRYLTQQDWDGDVVSVRPITDYDTD